LFGKIQEVIGHELFNYDPFFSNLNIKWTKPESGTLLQALGTFTGAGTPTEFLEAIKKFEFNNAVDINMVFAYDTQKTVDKANTKVIISSLMSSIVNQEKYNTSEEFITKLNTSLYNALASDETNQFTENLVELLKSNTKTLQQYGVTEQFISATSNASSWASLKSLASKNDLQ